MSNDDLVPRLRVLSGCTEEGYEADIIQKAADRIEALEARVAELLGALNLVWDKVLTEYHSPDSYVRQQVEAAIANAERKP